MRPAQNWMMVAAIRRKGASVSISMPMGRYINPIITSPVARLTSDFRLRSVDFALALDLPFVHRLSRRLRRLGCDAAAAGAGSARTA